MGYQTVPHNGNKPEDALHTFCVHVREKGYHRTFIVMAKDEATAISNFLCNIVALGAELKKTLKPEDCEPRTIQAYNQDDLNKADALSRELAETTQRLNDLGDEEDELTCIHRETLTESCAKLRERIQALRVTHETKIPSRFERMMERVSKLPAMTLTAERLDPQRCYAVAYFDDPRDYTGCAD